MLHPQHLEDFVNATFNVLIKRDSWKDISLDLQHYLVSEMFLSDRKMSVAGGDYIREQLTVRNPGNYEKTGWYATPSTKIVDRIKYTQVPWSMARVSFAYCIYELPWQQGPQMIMSTLAAKKQGMNNDLVEGEEYAMWDAPASATETPMSVWGIPHWFQRASGGQTAFGHFGGNPSGFSDMAGVDASTYTNWRNGTFEYSSFTNTDFYSKLLKAMEFSHFKPPMSYNEVAGGKPRYTLLTTYNVVNEFYLAQTASNDNLRNDIATWFRGPLFRGIPVQWVPALTHSDSPVYDATDPIYGIDSSSFKMFFRQGMEKTYHPPMRDSSQPDVIKRFVDIQRNFVCLDRRKNFVGYKAS